MEPGLLVASRSKVVDHADVQNPFSPRQLDEIILTAGNRIAPRSLQGSSTKGMRGGRIRVRGEWHTYFSKARRDRG
jgi:hypothetical protein